jgi:hypothetical protein
MQWKVPSVVNSLTLILVYVSRSSYLSRVIIVVLQVRCTIYCGLWPLDNTNCYLSHGIKARLGFSSTPQSSIRLIFFCLSHILMRHGCAGSFSAPAILLVAFLNCSGLPPVLVGGASSRSNWTFVPLAWTKTTFCRSRPLLLRLQDLLQWALIDVLKLAPNSRSPSGRGRPLDRGRPPDCGRPPDRFPWLGLITLRFPTSSAHAHMGLSFLQLLLDTKST